MAQREVAVGLGVSGRTVRPCLPSGWVPSRMLQLGGVDRHPVHLQHAPVTRLCELLISQSSVIHGGAGRCRGRGGDDLPAVGIASRWIACSTNVVVVLERPAVDLSGGAVGARCSSRPIHHAVHSTRTVSSPPSA